MMNTKIIGSIVLGSVLLVMHPGANAGKLMSVGVASPSGCFQYGGCDGPSWVETGTEAFRFAVSEAVGKSAVERENCPDVHVSIEPVSTGAVQPAC